MAVEQPSQQNEAVDLPAAPTQREALRRLGRDVVGRISHRPKQNLAVIAFVFLAVIGLGVGLSAVAPSAVEDNEPITLDTALAELDAGNFEAARQMAADLRVNDSLPPEGIGGPAYVLGVVMAHDAENHPHERERRILYLIATRYLQEAENEGYPEGRRGHGEFELGYCLYHAGLYADAIKSLELALEAYPQQTTQLCRLLSESCLRDTEPQLARAL